MIILNLIIHIILNKYIIEYLWIIINYLYSYLIILLPTTNIERREKSLEDNYFFIQLERRIQFQYTKNIFFLFFIFYFF